MERKVDSFNNILVTGPHRSGTTFAATTLAHDTGYRLALEEKIKFSNRYLVCCHLNDDEPWVIQCPFLSDVIHEFQWDDTLVIWMKRNLEDIRRSQQRMYGPKGYQISWWAIEQAERRKYHTTAHKPIAQIKNECWDLQKMMIPHWLEMEYDSLKLHPLYKAKRENFSFRQTSGDGIEKKPYRTVWNEGAVYL